MSWVLLGQLASTLPLCGLIWLVQLVVYPQFANVGTSQFATYHRFHSNRITWIVAPLMALELLSASAMLLQPHAAHNAAIVVGLALAVSAWGLTGLLAVPAHNRLARGFDTTAMQRLMLANTLRTIVWTLRATLVLYWASQLQGAA